MPEAPTILVDRRERSPLLQAELATRYGYAVRRTHLVLGDYVLPCGTVVERKTTPDFCLSIRSGRIFAQAYRLATAGCEALVIVEGPSLRARRPGLTLEAVKGTLIALAQTYRLPVLRTMDQHDTAWHLHRLVQQRGRIGEKCGPLHGGATGSLCARKLRMLRLVPGIGPKTARQLLERFGTIEHLAAASVADVTHTPGIGPKKARNIVATLHEAPAAYGNPKPDSTNLG